MFDTRVFGLDKDGRPLSQVFRQEVSHRYQALTIADKYDSMISPITGKREYGTYIIEHRGVHG